GQGDRGVSARSQPGAGTRDPGAGVVRAVGAGPGTGGSMTRTAELPVALVYHEDCLEHSNGPGHPERPERVRAIRDHLQAAGLLDRLLQVRPDACPIERIARVHAEEYIRMIRRACDEAPVRLDP